MKKIDRRSFIKNSSLACGGIFLTTHLPAAIFLEARAHKVPIGFQSWTVKDMLSSDFSGTMRKFAAMGYSQIEMCSPRGYAAIGFGAFTKMKPSEIKNTIEDSGLKCPSCHFGFGEFAPDQIDQSIDFALEMGLSQMICSTFWLPKTATLSDYGAAAEKLNTAASKIKKAGLLTGFHNHEFEFATLEGSLIYDYLMSRFDPGLVRMQFQTEVINLGYKAADYFRKYPGRFLSSHLSDWTKDKKEVPIGQGIIDWKEFFTNAKIGGVQNIFVEMDPGTFKDSASYLNSLDVSL